MVPFPPARYARGEMVCEILIRGLRYTDEGYDFLSKVPNYLNKDKFIYELP